LPWTERIFIEADGSIPQRKFYRRLAKKNPKLLLALLGKIKATVEVEGKIGPHIFKALHKPYSGLFEVRAIFGVDLARSLCCRDGDDLILLNGVKKRCEEETPDSDLREAVRLRDLYFATKRTEPS
jgi:hypothetical protein